MSSQSTPASPGNLELPEGLWAILAGPWRDGTRPKDLYEKIIKREPGAYVGALCDGLGSSRRRVQSGCAELCSLLSEDHPELIYPHLPRFVQALSAPQPVLRWEAACTLGNLAAVDEKRRIGQHTQALVALLQEDSIVLQAHAARALGKLALAYPRKAPAIVASLAGALDRFPGSRAGALLEALQPLAGVEQLRPALRAFAEPLAESATAAVAKRAQRLLKALGRQPPRRR